MDAKSFFLFVWNILTLQTFYPSFHHLHLELASSCGSLILQGNKCNTSRWCVHHPDCALVFWTQVVCSESWLRNKTLASVVNVIYTLFSYGDEDKLILFFEVKSTSNSSNTFLNLSLFRSFFSLLFRTGKQCLMEINHFHHFHNLFQPHTNTYNNLLEKTTTLENSNICDPKFVRINSQGCQRACLKSLQETQVWTFVPELNYRESIFQFQHYGGLG